MDLVVEPDAADRIGREWLSRLRVSHAETARINHLAILYECHSRAGNLEEGHFLRYERVDLVDKLLRDTRPGCSWLGRAGVERGFI
jgi:hypothetical protein